MDISYATSWPSFYTATINSWKPLLHDDRYKDVIIASLQFLVNTGRIRLNAFVIMSNHIHVIWQALDDYELESVQTSFKKFASLQFLQLLKNEEKLQDYKVNAADRKHHFWKRNSLMIELFTPKVFRQKLDYIHQNPVAAGLCNNAEEYTYSSASFYEVGEDCFNMLEHYAG